MRFLWLNTANARLPSTDVPLAIPGMKFLSMYGVRHTMIAAAALNAIGAVVRVFAWHPTDNSFIVALVASIFLSVSAPLYFGWVALCGTECAARHDVHIVLSSRPTDCRQKYPRYGSHLPSARQQQR